jgi:curli biogenesis system outer membrane secretion channel CsgG/ribosomal protein L40E
MFRFRLTIGRTATFALFLGAILTGCSATQESARRDTVTQQAGVGQFSPAPAGVVKPRVAVPPFNVQADSGSFGGGKDLNDLAADQMTSLLFLTERFKVIERAQLNQLLKEQNLEGIVRSDELAKQAKVRGVDYLLLGKVTNLRVKREQTSNSFGVGQVGNLVGGPGGNVLGGAAVSNASTNINTDCGVDIRLVDPTTGEIVCANFSEYSKTDSASSMGLTLLGANASSNADIQLSEDDKGKILRLALNDALTKSLPKLDSFLRSAPLSPMDAAPPAPAAPAPVAPAAPAAVSSVKYCPNCGAPNGLDAKFCGKCGQKLQ